VVRPHDSSVVRPHDLQGLARTLWQLMASCSRTLSDEPPPEPPKLRPKPQARGSIGAGKRYADKAAFDADVEAWEHEREEHKALMAERKRALDRQRDRSGRKRDSEAETDCQRRVRQRHEADGALQQHADVEMARRQARRRKKQEAWAHDVGAFAAVFDGWAPCHWVHGTPMSIAEAAAKGMRPQHPFAYNGFRRGWWLRDGAQILELHNFMQLQPPTGDEKWEEDVDACARRLWRKQGYLPPGCSNESDWHPACHPGDGYCMLLSLPSALPSMRAPDAVHALLERQQRLISPGVNDELAQRGFEPLRGWEPLVDAGYMPRPAYCELSADEIRRRRARFFFEDAFAYRPARILDTGFVPGIRNVAPGDRSHAAWKALRADQICALPGCKYHVCRCQIGVVLDANLNPVEPKRAARLRDC
jgi:hypothetical protein